MMLQLSDEWNHQEVVWAFGLRWYALLEANEKAQANRIIKELDAHSWVLSGEQICSVGLSNQRIRRQKQPVYIAAAAFFAYLNARQKVAAIIRLPTGQFWFVAAQQGRVLVRGDHCFNDLEQAQAFMSSVLADNPKLGCLHAHAAYIEWDKLIAQPTPADCIEKTRLRPRQRINTRWLVGGVVLGLLLVFYYVWVGWAAKQTLKSIEAKTEQSIDFLQPVLNLHPRATLQPLLEFLYQLPAQSMGWVLRHAECQLSLEEKGWRCLADYHNASGAADIEEFLFQQQWEELAQVVNLDAIQISFPLQSLLLEPWEPPTRVTKLQFLSYLHKQQAAFSQLHYQPRQQLLSEWQGRTALQIYGPLRSAHLLYEAPVHIQWYRARLDLNQQVQPSLKHSQLALTLEGAVEDAQLH